jgi:hypothetical protein
MFVSLDKLFWYSAAHTNAYADIPDRQNKYPPAVSALNEAQKMDKAASDRQNILAGTYNSCRMKCHHASAQIPAYAKLPQSYMCRSNIICPFLVQRAERMHEN